MVMGGDSCSKGREFKSHLFVVEIVLCLKRRKSMKKRPGMANFFLKKSKKTT